MASSRPRVTFFVGDLAGNSIARAAPLAAALMGDFAVELVGLLRSGSEVYAPYRGLHPYRVLPAPTAFRAALAVPRLARMATGDVLYACKPLPTTLLAALLAPGRRPVLLDVEDDEWAERTVDGGRASAASTLARLADTHRLGARLAHPLTRRAFRTTVSTRALQARYGGAVVRHGPDEARFDPARFTADERRRLRAGFGLPPDAPVALFAGRPRPHKGWQTLLDALEHPAAAAWHLASAGDPAHPGFAEAAARLGGRFHFAGAVPNADMPGLLAACDAAPIPQRDTVYARAQLPAKMLEALAMELPVVATPVGDAAEILGAGARGLLVPADDAPALAAALARVAGDPAAARVRAAAGRRWYLAEAGLAAMRRTLVPLVESALRAGKR
jgi:glycosyltransferase involved in cell wall biosynthesis